MHIGILGGSFHPIHNAHIAMARAAKEQLSLDRVILMPAAVPPHKQQEPLAPEADRLEMCRLATEGMDWLTVSDLELTRGGTSYTVDTLRTLAGTYPRDRLTLLVGGDMLKGLGHWRGAAEIFSLADIAVFPRPDMEEECRQLAMALHQHAGARVTVLDCHTDACSSTLVRTEIAMAHSVRGLVPDAVEQYLYANGLYLDETYNMAREKLIRTLGIKRYGHSIGVVRQCVYLAGLYAPGEDALARRALLAGLLHDCAKELPAGRLAVLAGDDYPEAVPVLHAPAGAVVAENAYGIRDEEILRAIRRHCTGDEGMTLLDEIVFLADLTEPGRTFPGVEKYRALLPEGPAAVMRAYLADTIRRIVAKGEFLHPATLRCAAFYGIHNE